MKRLPKKNWKFYSKGYQKINKFKEIFLLKLNS